VRASEYCCGAAYNEGLREVRSGRAIGRAVRFAVRINYAQNGSLVCPVKATESNR